MQFKHIASLGKASLSIEDRGNRKYREMWGQKMVVTSHDNELTKNIGTTRAYVNNHVLGVSEGHVAILRLVGVGYRASVEETSKHFTPAYLGQQYLNLRLGYAHPIDMAIPQGVKASTPQPTRILLEGPDKEVLKQFAAEIREWRKPEPYKGKGIFVNDETIKLKAKKIK